MQNTQNPARKKQDILLQEVNDLEIQIAVVKDKMYSMENEEKQENYKKNLFEVKKDNLNRSIEFFKNEAKKTDRKLDEKLAVLSKLSMVNECYDKLLEVYREKYFAPQNSNLCQEDALLEESVYFQKQTADSKKKVEELKSIIDGNSSTIQNYLEDMHYVIQ